MKELAGQRISTAKASTLMQLLQEKYQLTDEDLPGMSDLINTRKSGTVVDSTPDIDERFKSFKAELVGELEKKFVGAMVPELGSMASIPLIWSEIDREHEELTGKRLSFAEKQEILKSAQSGSDSSMGKGSIYGIWQDKYQIGGDTGVRAQKSKERIIADARSQWDKEQADQRSKDALNVVTPQQREFGSGSNISLAFRNGPLQGKDGYHPPTPGQFDQQQHQGGGGDQGGGGGVTVLPGQHVRQSSQGRVPAGQRAAQKFLERGGPGGYGKGKVA